MMSFEARFVQELQTRLTEDIQAAHASFGKGGWINRADAAATGMAAVLIQAKIEGLEVARKHLQQVYDAMTGKAEKRKEREPA